MAVTQQESDQIVNMDASPPSLPGSHTIHGKVRIAYFDFTQSGAGDAGSLAELVRLPPGTVRVLNPLSFIGFQSLSGT